MNQAAGYRRTSETQRTDVTAHPAAVNCQKPRIHASGALLESGTSSTINCDRDLRMLLSFEPRRDHPGECRPKYEAVNDQPHWCRLRVYFPFVSQLPTEGSERGPMTPGRHRHSLLACIAWATAKFPAVPSLCHNQAIRRGKAFSDLETRGSFPWLLIASSRNQGAMTSSSSHRWVLQVIRLSSGGAAACSHGRHIRH